MLWVKWRWWWSMITIEDAWLYTVYHSFTFCSVMHTFESDVNVNPVLYFVHCQSCMVRLHVHADFIFPVFSLLGHDKRISSFGFHFPFRMSVHDFSNEHERACWDCWVTWRYNRIARRALTFNIFPLSFLRHAVKTPIGENVGRWATLEMIRENNVF